MKKSVFDIVFAIIIAIMLVSCVDQTGLLVSTQREVELIFTFKTDNNAITRAISDGNSVDQLNYAIISNDGQLVVKSVVKRNVTTLVNGGTLSMTISLADGQKYKAIFWAQSSECQAFTISEDMNLTVDYTLLGNSDNGDAFYGVSEYFEPNGEITTVTLRRPFAQVNAVAYPFDWEYVTDFYGFNIVKSSSIIRDVPNQMNLLTGAVSGTVDAVSPASEIPAERYYADVDEDGVNEEYIYLSMSYVLAGEEKTTHEADFFFIDENNMAVMYENEAQKVIELQRNNHTDVIGQVITDNGELNMREYIPATTIYYNIANDSIISDKIYNMSGHDAVQFASTSGQKMTLENVLLTGDIWTIELGEYRGASYVNYNNELNNVVFKDLCSTSIVEIHEWYFSPACIAYGNTVLNNCVMTGATTTHTTITDTHGTHEVIPVDIGVRNESDAVVNGGVFGTFLAWTHAVVDIFDAVIDTLYCGTCDSTKHSWLTVGAGTVIDKIICCEPRKPYPGLDKEFSTTMTIKKGAQVGSIQLVSTDVEFLIIEDGASVGSITCEGVEYTYEELRSAMGL